MINFRRKIIMTKNCANCVFARNNTKGGLTCGLNNKSVHADHKCSKFEEKPNEKQDEEVLPP